MFRPAYHSLSRDQLRERVRRGLASLEDCRACPRDCRVNRLENRWSACKTGRYAVVGSYFPHFGEEDCLRGWNGSGTIFFSHCNLRCVFCQNYDISQAIAPPRRESRRQRGRGAEGEENADCRPQIGDSSALPPGRSAAAPPTRDQHESSPAPHSAASTPDQIAQMMMELQGLGCHNINFVTPEHVVPQVMEAVEVAIHAGLRLPIVYNTSAYDSLESVELMDDIVDIYMPDFKYWSSARSHSYMKAGNYPDAARAAIRAMHQQVGPLRLNADGLATRGLLLRHLVMPGCLDETQAILEWIARELGTDTYVNLMDQYYPAGRVSADRFPEINRRLTSAEFQSAVEIAQELGLRRLDARGVLRRRARSVLEATGLL